MCGNSVCAIGTDKALILHFTAVQYKWDTNYFDGGFSYPPNLLRIGTLV